MRKLFGCFLISCLLLCSLAQAQEDYSVNIKVDVTDQDAATAREKAIAGASKSAVMAAVKRMTDKDGIEKFSEMNNNQIINFIKETSVSDEKTSTNRYMANLHLVVNSALLQTYMQERQITLFDKIVPSVVIIPILSNFKGDTPMLWELENTWKQAWDNNSSSSSVNLAVLKDSSGNISTISAQQASDLDSDILKEIKQLNAGDDVFVLAATYDGIDGLDIAISSLSGYREKIHIDGVKSEEQQLFKQAIAEIIPLIEEYMSSFGLEQINQGNEITVLFPFNELGDWVAAEQKIKSIEAVSDLQVQAFSPGKAQFIVQYQGELDDLIRSFKSSGYDLEESGNYMVMSYIGD